MLNMFVRWRPKQIKQLVCGGFTRYRASAQHASTEATLIQENDTQVMVLGQDANAALLPHNHYHNTSRQQTKFHDRTWLISLDYEFKSMHQYYFYILGSNFEGKNVFRAFRISTRFRFCPIQFRVFQFYQNQSQPHLNYMKVQLMTDSGSIESGSESKSSKNWYNPMYFRIPVSSSILKFIICTYFVTNI